MTRLIGVGRICEQQADAVTVGEGTDPGQVGQSTVDGSEVNLEVARMKNRSLGRVDRRRDSLWDRVGRRE